MDTLVSGLAGHIIWWLNNCSWKQTKRGAQHAGGLCGRRSGTNYQISVELNLSLNVNNSSLYQRQYDAAEQHSVFCWVFCVNEYPVIIEPILSLGGSQYAHRENNHLSSWKHRFNSTQHTPPRHGHSAANPPPAALTAPLLSAQKSRSVVQGAGWRGLPARSSPG